MTAPRPTARVNLVFCPAAARCASSLGSVAMRTVRTCVELMCSSLTHAERNLLVFRSRRDRNRTRGSARVPQAHRHHFVCLPVPGGRGVGASPIQRPTFMTDHRHLQGRVSKRQVCMYTRSGAVQFPFELCQCYHCGERLLCEPRVQQGGLKLTRMLFFCRAAGECSGTLCRMFRQKWKQSGILATPQASKRVDATLPARGGGEHVLGESLAACLTACI